MHSDRVHSAGSTRSMQAVTTDGAAGGSSDESLTIGDRVALVLFAFGALAVVVWVIAGLARGAGADSDFGQPRVEREAQQRLPQSSNPLWKTLRTTEISVDERTGLFSARFPPAVRALDGKTVSVEGFMMPLESKVETHHFLLSKRTPVCPFCPPGQPNEVIEVYSPSTIVPTTDEIAVTGRFGIRAQDGLFFRLDDAEVR